MTCPHCQKEQPEDYAADCCRYCGQDFSEVQTASDNLAKISWPLFFVVLFAPAVISFVSLACNLGGLMVAATFGGSLLAGKICATMLDQQRGYSTLVQLLVTLMLAALSFILCFGGCMAGTMIPKH